MALGADRGVHIQTDMRTDSQLQPLAVAKLLQKIVIEEKINLVLLGKQAIDDDSNQTGQLLAGLMGWPQATFASKISFDSTTNDVEVRREVDVGLQTLRFKLPGVVTCDLRLNEPRYATLPNLMKARKKQIRTTTPKELGVDVTPRLELLSFYEPPKREGGKILPSVDALLQQLLKEEKVLDS
eukprot:GHVT01096050.1.p1 GENE.GHVT01096050.1~~GHVT01096050.1.p1  ORF type:complete len:183 (-),score=48.35 GHVT01096050.1:189-737(-)